MPFRLPDGYMISPHGHIVHYSLPDDHTFGPGGEVMHIKSFKLLDFNFLTAVEITITRILSVTLDPLNTVRDRIKEEHWTEAWYILDAICVYLSMISKELSSSGDKEGIRSVNETFSILLVQTVQALDATSQLTTSVLPDLEFGLERFTRWGLFVEKQLGLDSAFLDVVQELGAKLFWDRTKKARAKLRRARMRSYRRFLKHASKSDRETRKLLNGKYEVEVDEDEELWDAKISHETSAKAEWLDFLEQAEDDEDGHESTLADWDSNMESRSISDSVSQFSLTEGEEKDTKISDATVGKIQNLDIGGDDEDGHGSLTEGEGKSAENSHTNGAKVEWLDIGSDD